MLAAGFISGGTPTPNKSSLWRYNFARPHTLRLLCKSYFCCCFFFFHTLFAVTTEASTYNTTKPGDTVRPVQFVVSSISIIICTPFVHVKAKPHCIMLTTPSGKIKHHKFCEHVRAAWWLVVNIYLMQIYCIRGWNLNFPSFFFFRFFTLRFSKYLELSIINVTFDACNMGSIIFCDSTA